MSPSAFKLKEPSLFSILKVVSLEPPPFKCKWVKGLSILIPTLSSFKVNRLLPLVSKVNSLFAGENIPASWSFPLKLYPWEPWVVPPATLIPPSTSNLQEAVPVPSFNPVEFKEALALLPVEKPRVLELGRYIPFAGAVLPSGMKDVPETVLEASNVPVIVTLLLKPPVVAVIAGKA